MRENKKEHIVVGMSGGVDSAVAAMLLKNEGYAVTGVFMKNWGEKDETGACTAASDYEDALSVCGRLRIPCYTVNFEKQYYECVFSYFLEEYRKGRTPNPDVLCNAEIKFKAFLDFAMRTGARRMATGHYARLEKRGHLFLLKKGADAGKDQSYFLCALKQAQLEKAVFPVGHLQKSDVRRMAREAGLAVAEKKDSTGICFIGERKFREFLRRYLPAQPGDVVSAEGERVGRHEGLMYYTIGQRRGLGIGGRGSGARWFVAEKDVEKNRLVVVQGEGHPKLYSSACRTGEMHFVAGEPPAAAFACRAKFRYRQSDQDVYVRMQNGAAHIEFAKKQRAVTPGQYAVLYDGDVCLGGGVVEQVYE